MKKIQPLPMGFSRLSRKFLIVPPNSNTLAFMIMINFTAASGLVGSGSFVTNRNLTKRGPTCSKRIIPIDPSLIYILEVFSFLLSRYSLRPSSRWTNQARSSPIISFLPDPFLCTLKHIRCYSHCFRSITRLLPRLRSCQY
jgi:hypothetical protein